MLRLGRTYYSSWQHAVTINPASPEQAQLVEGVPPIATGVDCMQHNLARQHRIALASSYVTMCHTGWGQWWCIWRCVWCDCGCTKDNKEGSPSTAPSSQLARALCLLREQPVAACANTKEAWSKAYSCLWSGHQPTREATSPLAAAPIAVGCASTKEARQSWPYSRVRSPMAAAGPSACQRCYVPISRRAHQAAIDHFQ